MKRKGDVITVGCDGDDDETRTLHCAGNKWVGHGRNCTSTSVDKQGKSHRTVHRSELETNSISHVGRVSPFRSTILIVIRGSSMHGTSSSPAQPTQGRSQWGGGGGGAEEARAPPLGRSKQST